MANEINPQTGEGWGRKQRVWTALNVLAMVILALLLLAGLNYWASRGLILPGGISLGFRIDATFRQEYALSDKTKNLLKNLKEPVTLYSLFGDSFQDEASYQAFTKLKDLIEEYKAVGGSNFIYEALQPIQSPELVELLKQKLKLGTVALNFNDMIFVCGDRQKNINLVETFERTQPQGWGDPGKMKTFKGEEAVTAAILSILQAKKPVVYFTAGHKEPEIEGTQMPPGGYTSLNAHIKRENIETKSINLLDKTGVPDDCETLVIAGAQQRFTEPEIQMVNNYLNKGGRAIVLIDPMMESGLEGLLKDWGVKLDDGVILDAEQSVQIFGPYVHIVANDFGRHTITYKMTADNQAIFVWARPVELAPGAAGMELVKSGPASWLETNSEVLTGKKQPKYDKNHHRKGPLGVAVVITKDVPGQSVAPDARKETRLVVIGDSDHLNNKFLSTYNKSDVFMNSLRWMLGNEVLISIESKKPENTRLDLTPGKRSFLFWFAIVILPCVGAILGIFMWLMRRK